VVGKNADVDTKRSSYIGEHDLALDIAGTNGVIVVVSSLAVRHLGGDRKNRLAAILHHCENAGGVLCVRLSVTSSQQYRGLQVAPAKNDPPGSLNRLLILLVGLLRLDDNFNLASILRVAWCYQTEDRDQGYCP